MTRPTVVATEHSRVFPRELDRAYPLITKAEGAWLFDAGGMAYLDAVSGGAMVTSLGQGIGELAQVAAEQSRSGAFLYSQQFTSPAQEELAQRLIEIAPEGFGRVHFVAGGAEANETALRLARAYHVERGEPRRWRVISPAQAYHGPTMSTLALTGRGGLQHPFEPYLAAHLHIPPSTWRFDPTGHEALAALDRALAEAGPESVAAFFCEPISAAALPAYSPPDAFWHGLEERRREHGFLVVFDEVVTGLGRTGTWFAAHTTPLKPDIITTSKGLGAGYIPIGAALCTERVYEAFENGSRAFELGHTWGGAPLQCAVGIAVIEYLRRHHLVERVAELGPRILSELRQALGGFEMVREVRGRGFLFGIDYVDPGDGESMLPVELGVAREIDQAALGRGLIVYSTQPTVDGYAGDQTLIAPPFICSEHELELLVERMRETVAAVQRLVKTRLTRPVSRAGASTDPAK